MDIRGPCLLSDILQQSLIFPQALKVFNYIPSFRICRAEEHKQCELALSSERLGEALLQEKDILECLRLIAAFDISPRTMSAQ